MNLRRTDKIGGFIFVDSFEGSILSALYRKAETRAWRLGFKHVRREVYKKRVKILTSWTALNQSYEL
ncbi:hypothetical protein T10_488 [Trichinella papuae]|uniref:Uncharacterized protein n=1 Tax=Trichinella papuae TaxID=268474 RepID=A0A0V1MMR2_9BILA|nr:hypothetical protein T10_488 [Trichinella papuae]